MIIGIVLILIILAISLEAKGAGIIPVDMTLIQKVYDQWSDIADNWSNVNSPITKQEILAIIVNESSGNPLAFNPGDPSYGLMGVSELIGRTYGRIDTVEDLYIPEKNVGAGSTFLAYLKKKYQNTFPSYQWVQMYNEGETSFLKGNRVQGYQEAFMSHLQMIQQYESGIENQTLGSS
jgi:hypothetical protein